GSFATALDTMTNLKILTSVPVFAFDMLGAVFSASLAACGYVQERVLSIETVLFGEEESVKGHFLLLTEPPSLKRLFSALGIDLVDSKQEHT
ncbi:MAG: CheY-P-specific phosphatase CheC, partial [Deltaproteobacteria bacterium]|nr:CheY-P-specific phosphatase CheC [Deltaproteobacteria bacterium]